MCDMGGDYTVGKAMVNPRFAVQRKFTFRHLTGCGKSLCRTRGLYIFGFGGSPCIYAGEDRFSAPEKLRIRPRALARYREIPGLRPIYNQTLFRWTRVQLPPAEAWGSPPKVFHRVFPQPVKCLNVNFLWTANIGLTIALPTV